MRESSRKTWRRENHRNATRETRTPAGVQECQCARPPYLTALRPAFEPLAAFFFFAAAVFGVGCRPYAA